jgi:hypothetical protein
MFCSKCGTEVSDGSSFCPKCGAKLNDGIESQTSHSTQSQEPEQILLKAVVTAEQLEPPNFGINNGKLIITNKRLVYTSSRLLNVDVLGTADSDLSIYYNEIAEFKKTHYNLVFPAIEVTTNNGYKIKFGGYGKINVAYELVCKYMKQ